MYRDIKQDEVRIDKTLGYRYFIDRSHPLAHSSNGKVYLHRHVASVAAGRWVEQSEVVHHLDEDRGNNDPANLEILGRAEHSHVHNGFAAEKRACAYCGIEIDVSHPTRKRRSKVYCSHEHARASREVIDWLPSDELRCMVDASSYSAVGRQLGVSDTAIRKRLKNHS